MIKRLEKLVRNYTHNDDLVITEDTVFFMDLGLDSFDLVQIICEIEDEFDIEIPDKVLKTFNTVGDVVKYLEKKVK